MHIQIPAQWNGLKKNKNKKQHQTKNKPAYSLDYNQPIVWTIASLDYIIINNFLLILFLINSF